ncbi:MAG: MogA/MoaB family molybdenum cofactor biosynthesis protein [Proteobacteria bacterium]|nr:MogA/MoaB family molybdenum cofactor biosynthesis protein [Pseudomonadota bacterium]MBU1056918.1 MogA/MoaB family molybdenum cofactor biosynthesis protein [Pseudomonadota bacterium]
MDIDTTRFCFGVLTMSDKGARGEREDTSGPFLQQLLTEQGYVSRAYAIIPDQVERIKEKLISWVDEEKIDLILTTGGTGVAPTDVTPEAMLEVIEKEIPGMADAMRAASLRKTPNAVLSRGMAGIRGTSLIINLPGSKKAARENIEVLLPALAHALDKIQGGTSDCGS